MHMHYILDEQGNAVPEDDYIKWAVWYEKAERHVGDTFFGEHEDIRVSTVFLSLNHGASNGPPQLYETMVFADDKILARLLELSERDDRSIIAQMFGDIDIQRRYATKEQALEGHQRMCHFIEVCLAKGLILLEACNNGVD